MSEKRDKKRIVVREEEEEARSGTETNYGANEIVVGNIAKIIIGVLFNRHLMYVVTSANQTTHNLHAQVEICAENSTHSQQAYKENSRTTNIRKICKHLSLQQNPQHT